MNNNNAQTAEINSGTPLIPPIRPSEASVENSKLILTPSTVTDSTVSSPSSFTSRLSEEHKEQISTSKKNCREEITPNKSSPDIAQDCVTPPEVNKSPLPRRKQTNVTNISPIKVSPAIPSGSTNDSLIPLTPKKPIATVAVVPPSSPVTPAGNVSSVVVALSTTPENEVKQIKKESNVPKSTKTIKTEPTSPSKPSSSKSKSITSHLVEEDVPVSLDDDKSKRHRFKTIPFQSPTPDLVLATKMSVTEAYGNSTNTKDKLIVFYKDEFLAVRNDDSSFFLCQCRNNVYKSTKKCNIVWLDNFENSDDIYKMSFFDKIDMECILTSLELEKLTADSYKLTQNEKKRIENILKKSIDVENGLAPPEVTEANPDGLDISLFKNESQLEVKSTDESSSPAPKRKLENSPKSNIPQKKFKKNLKSAKQRSQSRGKSYSSDKAFYDKSSLNKNGKSSKKTSSHKSSSRSLRSSLSSSKSHSLHSSNEKEESLTKQTTKPKDNSKNVVEKQVAKTRKTTKSSPALKKSSPILSENKSSPTSSPMSFNRLRKRSSM